MNIFCSFEIAVYHFYSTRFILRMHGEGIYTWPDGHILKGTFTNNRLKSQSIVNLKDPSGHEWTGLWNGDNNVLSLATMDELKSRGNTVQTRLALKLTSL